MGSHFDNDVCLWHIISNWNGLRGMRAFSKV